MPNLPISQLPELTAITTNAEYAVAQNGVTYRVKNGNIHPNGLWGSFVSLQSQYVASTTTAYSMTAETQTSGNGVIVSSDTRFVVASAGTYNLQFSSQVESTGGGSAQTMDIWLAINGTNVDYSNTQIVGNSNNGRSVAAWNFVEPMNAGDYFELKFKVSDTRLGFAYDPANINPTRPSIPSVIVTVTQV